MTTYICWCEEFEGEPVLVGTPARNVITRAYDAEHAAEVYAERLYSEVDHQDSFDIHVRAPDGTVDVVDVSVKSTPTFYGAVKP
jgi:hypothetical protein